MPKLPYKPKQRQGNYPTIPTPIDRDSLSIIIDRSQGKEGIDFTYFVGYEG